MVGPLTQMLCYLKYSYSYETFVTKLSIEKKALGKISSGMFLVTLTIQIFSRVL